MNKQYKNLLSYHVKKSGLTLRQIAQQCKDRGQQIAPSYISKLQNGHLPPPSETVSRVLADVLGGNSDAFVYSGYIEKAPSAIRGNLDAEDVEIPGDIFSFARKLINLSPRNRQKIITQILLLEKSDSRELTFRA